MLESSSLNPDPGIKNIYRPRSKDKKNLIEGDSLEQAKVEGVSFDGSSIIKESLLDKPPSKLKRTATVLLDKFHYLKDKAESALVIGSILVDKGRAVNEISKVFFEPCRVLDKILTPLRFLSWTAAPFVAYSFVNNGVDFFTTPGLGKILPVMKSIVDVGVAAEMAANAAFLLQDLGIAAAQNVTVWAIPLGGVALGLQSVALAINGWGFLEVTNSLRKLDKILKENNKEEGFTKAVDLLTKKPNTKLERFRAKFFKILSPSQEARIVRIHEKLQAGELKNSDMKRTLKAVKHRFHLKQFGYALAIIASVAGIIGVAILLFGPTPIAPIGWLFIGMSAATSLTLVGVNIYANKRLDRELKTIDPEPLPNEKPPFYKKTYTWIRTKFKTRRDGSYEQVLDNSP